MYHGFRSLNHNIYKENLDIAAKLDLTLNLIYQDRNGILDIAKIFKENGSESNYFTSGSPIMIKNFKNKLIKKGIHKESVLTDDWEKSGIYLKEENTVTWKN